MKLELKVINSNENIKWWILFIFLCYQPLYQVLNNMLGSSALAHGLLVLGLYAPFVYLFFVKKEPVRRIYLTLALVLISVFCIYGILNFNNDFLLESYALPSCISFFTGIIGFYIMVIQDDYRKIVGCLKVTAIVLTVYYYVYTLTIENSASYQYGYDMYLGFRALFPCLLSFYFFLEKKEKINLAQRIIWICVAFLNVYIILTYGSRGPFLGIMMFFFMRFWIMFLPRRDISTVKKVFISFLIIVLIIFGIINLESFLLALGNRLGAIGITSRTLTRFLNGTIIEDNGRAAVFAMAINKINVLGNGPFSDQFFFGEGNYCHNFFLELLFDFGLLGGTIALFLLAYIFVKILKRSYKTEWCGLFLVLFSYCFGRLMFSGTFWSETYFWMMIGVGYTCLRKSGEYTDELDETNTEDCL